MLVCVTGGTGFVGSHAVAALSRAGHQVRLLRGDVVDARAVGAAVRGVDAVVHAAGVYSFDSRRHRELWRTNVTGTETVLAAARWAGVGRVVYVSTFGALLPSDGDLRPESPVGRPREAYLASKAAAESIARRHQADGAPVSICYPPGLLGPDCSRLGDQRTRLRDLLRGLLPVWPRGGVPLGDVRDTAATLVDLLACGPTRRFAPGRFVTTERYVQAVRELTGRPLPAVFLPAGPMLPLGGVASALQRVWPWHIPAEYGAIYVCAHARWTGQESGTPFTTTLADTVRWLYDAGHVTAPQAGPPARLLTSDRG